MLNQVAIPASHFTQSVRRFYSEPNSALVREVVQNSIDAGSTKVDMVFCGDGFSVKDNGCGMTEDVVTRGLLTYSGSVKSAGAVGGFGVAKEIILFQHQGYTLRTGTVEVTGQHLAYNIRRGLGAVVGTELAVTFHEDYQLDHDDFRQKALSYLTSCETAAKLTWNGEPVHPLVRKGKLVRELPWAKIYARRTTETTEYAYVRANGVTMFRHYIGATKLQVVVEITGKTTDVLSASRDNFSYQAGRDFQQLLHEVVVDKKSFDRPPVRKQIIFKGKPVAAPVVEVSISPELLAVAARSISEAPAAARPAPVPSGEKLQTDTVEHVTQHDFVIDLGGRAGMPAWLRPDSWGKRQLRLAQLWRHCCGLVIAANPGLLEGMEWTVGWTLNPEFEAFHNLDGCRSLLQLNPLLIKSWDPKNLFFTLLKLAAHEIAHRRHSFHDESFVHHAEDLHTTTLIKLDSWYTEYTASFKVAI